MSRRARAVSRATALCAVTCAFYLLYCLVLPFAASSKSARRAWRNYIFRKWATATAAVLRMRIEVIGSPPRPPFLLVSNHLSYVDIVAFGSLLDCVFVAKSDVAGWPVIGRLCKSMKTIFIDRARRRDIPRAAERIAAELERGQAVVLFAEGTSTDGAGVAPFKPGLLEPAARARFPVSHASISYRTGSAEAPARLAVCWWGEMTFLKHLAGLLQIEQFYATLVFGSEAIREDDRKALARRLRAAVSELRKHGGGRMEDDVRGTCRHALSR